MPKHNFPSIPRTVTLFWYVLFLAFSPAQAAAAASQQTDFADTARVTIKENPKGLSVKNRCYSALYASSQFCHTLKQTYSPEIAAHKCRLISEIFKDTLKLGAVGGGSYYLLTATSNDEAAKPAPSARGSDFLIGTLVAGVMQKTVGNLGNNLVLLLCPRLANSTFTKVVEYQGEFERVAPYVSQEMREWIEASLERYRFIAMYWGFNNKELETAIDMALKLPILPKKITLKGNEKLRLLLSSYSNEVRKKLATFANEVAQASQHPNPQRRVAPLMMVGPPGTGKTHLIREFAACMELPFFVAQPAHYADLSGTNMWSQNPEKGLILDFLLACQRFPGSPANGFIVFDEIDKVFKRSKNGNFLHTNALPMLTLLYGLLETQTTTMPIKFFDSAGVKCVHPIVILVVNEELKDVLDAKISSSLGERFVTIKNKGFSKEAKLQIVKERIALFLRDLPPETREEISIDEAIIEEIIAKDGSPGVRQLLIVLNQYLSTLSNHEEIEMLAGGTVQFEVNEAYASIAENCAPAADSTSSNEQTSNAE